MSDMSKQLWAITAQVDAMQAEFDRKAEELAALETDLGKLRQIKDAIMAQFPDLKAPEPPVHVPLPQDSEPVKSDKKPTSAEMVLWALKNRQVTKNGQTLKGLTTAEVGNEIRYEYGSTADPLADWVTKAGQGMGALARAKKVRKGFAGRYYLADE